MGDSHSSYTLLVNQVIRLLLGVYFQSRHYSWFIPTSACGSKGDSDNTLCTGKIPVINLVYTNTSGHPSKIFRTYPPPKKIKHYVCNVQ